MDPATTPADLSPLSRDSNLSQIRTDFTRFMMEYKFGMDEIETKISILQEEFTHLHDYNPIEHVLTRLKTPESILEKTRRRGLDPSFEAIRDNITDIAGVRVTCSFVRDVYQVYDMLSSQPDIEVMAVKDYIEHPKPNGYRSLHALVRVPVHLSDRVVPVTVEMQLRTVAMDFWASLEHKIYYKYREDVPQDLLQQLQDAAQTAADLDARMERLHVQINSHKDSFGQSSGTELADHVVQQLHEMRESQGGRRFV
ncbi:GTP pyrophosphokinase [Ornithinimicrobium ciconiae]